MDYTGLTTLFTIQCGVNADATDRVLLRSLKPSLHTNVDCTALVAAIVSRQIAVVRQLLQVTCQQQNCLMKCPL